ncbi:hypothetical protein A3K24_00630 [candidate division Kazan bacterium RIFCSPHIGHO2_01_FULL_44_14]|uniref:Major facilitator superfamily (MFS) profile domain-containing protein n=1 Tax=candidate division Kazan bacterium RIFCSPLOWO2_01_FULL_45_19 TaxID=1798538 RepID=A0A1F4NPM8_UNCK3|nr:MAG: hypothetical protein A3K51_00630 [candidate division Kazan bacterium RIFCSPLOWO2_01_FULL_45_19]OGB77615.1 MAG: hypothetical protein A3K24_00630 [candidate division Kazan bacterium RIFCSPHIGHO2_01_FULL_44_14]
MPVTSYLIGTAITTGLTIIAWSLVLIYFDPTTVGYVGLVLFLISLGVTMVGGFTLVLYALYTRLTGAKRFWTALRHGALLGLAGIGVLILQWLNVLAWWNIVMVVVIGLLLEVYFKIKVE